MRILSSQLWAAGMAVSVLIGSERVVWGQPGPPVPDDTLRKHLTNNADDAKVVAESSPIFAVGVAAWQRRYALLQAILEMPGPRPAVLWRDIGEAAEHTSRPLEALRAFEECQRLLPDMDPLAVACESLARRVRTGQLATLRLALPSPPAGIELLVGDERVGQEHRADPIALLPGTVNVVALAPGFERFSQQLTVIAGREYSLDVSLRALPEPPPPTPEPQPTPAVPTPSATQGAPETAKKTWGALIGILSVGVGPAWASFPSARYVRAGASALAYAREDVACVDTDPCTTGGREGWGVALAGKAMLMTIGASSEWIEVGARGMLIGLPTAGDFGGGGVGGPWFLGRLGPGPAWLGFGVVAGALSMPFSVEGGEAFSVSNMQGAGIIIPREDDAVWASTGFALGVTSELRFVLTPDDSPVRIDLYTLPTVLRGDGALVVLVPIGFDLLLDLRRDLALAP